MSAFTGRCSDNCTQFTDRLTSKDKEPTEQYDFDQQ